MYTHIGACVCMLSTTCSSSFTMQCLPENSRLKLIKFIFMFSFKYTALGFLCLFLGARSVRTVSHSVAQADTGLARLLIQFPGARITGVRHCFFPTPMLGIKPRDLHVWGKFYTEVHHQALPFVSLILVSQDLSKT